jgi:hypothetical protein
MNFYNVEIVDDLFIILFQFDVNRLDVVSEALGLY